jgi:predicted nucleic acid-binding protein
MAEYFYDSYAIIEYLRGNRRFQKYFKDPLGVTTRLNLMEVYYSLLDNEEYADEVYSSFSTVAIEPTDAQIKKAMKKRKELRKDGLNISYADAIGYVISFDLNIKFLTGDKEFIDLPNVEYVR